MKNEHKTHKRPLPIGFSDFKEVRENGCYYIDKTLFIKEITKASAKVLLIPRPRRFGKTLNLSMLRYFYEKTGKNQNACDEDIFETHLFKGLSVCNEDIFETHRERYPLIWLTFKDAKELDWKAMYRKLTNILRDEFLRHNILLKSDILEQTEQDYFEAILNRKAELPDYTDALRYLSDFLRRYHNERVVILIDEYDTPIHSAYAGGYYKEVVSFMRNLLSGGLKDNEHLFKGVVTGILRVAKESIFSGLNNLDVFTLLDEEFNSSFGFTDEEVRLLLKDYGLSDRYDEVSEWYNGYLFGGEIIYNPWSVLSYVNRKSVKARPYWVNTADTGMIDDLATRGGRELREELGHLLEGAITKPVYDNIAMRDLDKRDDLLWSFLLFSGYLKIVEEIDYDVYRLQIPNQEVRTIYERMVRTWFTDKVEFNRLETMLKALEDGNVKLFEQILREVVLQIMSYHDFSGTPEKVYHALVTGMLVWMSGKYEIRSNRESGYGRYDLMLKPKDTAKQGIIIEFKKVYEDDSPEDVLEEALNQIEDKKYVAELEGGGIKNILKIAVVFRGKELWVKT
ncbi:MAG: AAA family ATPase [Desulfobacteraceae bacterium]|nr:AAA family ATPase [Desulfobacteraceae bacterium]